jgi:hypothetical protein
MMKKVYVEWEDASGLNDGWMPFEKARGQNLDTKSLGYLVCDEEKYIGITSTIDEENGNMHNCMIIPRKMISKYVEFE